MEQLDRKAILETEILTVEAMRWLVDTPPEALPDLACRALEAGLDTPALVELAGMDRPTWIDAAEVWWRALKQLRLPLLTEEQAAHFLVLPLATQIGQRFLDGKSDVGLTLAALEGLNEKYGHRGFLEDFCPLCSSWAYLESEYPGQHRATLEAEFLAALKTLMALVPFDRARAEATEAALYRKY